MRSLWPLLCLLLASVSASSHPWLSSSASVHSTCRYSFLITAGDNGAARRWSLLRLEVCAPPTAPFNRADNHDVNFSCSFVVETRKPMWTQGTFPGYIAPQQPQPPDSNCNPSCGHLALVAPSRRGPLRMCSKIRQKVSYCNVVSHYRGPIGPSTAAPLASLPTPLSISRRQPAGNRQLITWTILTWVQNNC
ncbi:hypothetical protein J0S82_004319 [Galemys pyrenaicus]|uniref:Uncharacterized protein n=1 Tax=Galemys pyrenaicus TaxID=202257 RepID=A0A8J6APB4_GALPY|nr:hypothetical protein J0S82_004319 [Galemys pyrenaicus]